MKTQRIVSLSSNKNKNLVEEKKKDIDFVKWISLIITLSGVFFWVAGTGYESGYWYLLGADGSFIPRTFQRTALTGFIGPFKIWFVGVIGLLAYAMILFFLEFISITTYGAKTVTKILIPVENWFRKKNFAKSNTLKFPIILIVVCTTAFATIAPFLLIISLAYNEGRNQMDHEICDARIGKKFPTQINLFDGTKAQGKFIGRSEKLSVLLNDKTISVITVSDKPQVIDVTSVLAISCNVEK